MTEINTMLKINYTLIKINRKEKNRLLLADALNLFRLSRNIPFMIYLKELSYILFFILINKKVTR